MKKLIAVLPTLAVCFSVSATSLIVCKTNTIDDVKVEFRWQYDADFLNKTAKLITVTPQPVGEIEIPSALLIGSGVNDTLAVVEIGDYAFADCKALASVKIPYGIRRIGKRPFVNTIIPELTLPDSLLDMDGNITAGAIFDMKLNISDSSHFTYSDDGVLYNKDMTKLYACPTRAEGTVTIPATVTNICADAFFGCFRLSYLNIPENVSTIGDDAFNVKGIWPGLDAPESVPKLKSVFYSGPIPNAADDIYANAPADLVTYAFTDDWNTLSTWKDRPVTVVDDQKPPILSFRDGDGITWYYRIVNGTAEIYNEVNGKAVAAISPTSTAGVRYYKDKDSLTYMVALKVPNSINGYAVTKIGKHAFVECKALTYVGIPASVQELDDGAFKDCTAIRHIGPYDDSFPFGVPDGQIILPAGISKIGYHAFEGLKSSSISIPYTMNETIGNPLAGMDFVTSVDVDASNPKFHSSNNIIYSKNRSIVIGVPSNYDGSSISFLSSVTKIGNEALYRCVNLGTITLPDTLTTISSNAFAGCANVASLTVPSTVTDIEAAFDGCDSLIKVSYEGNAPNAPDNLYAGTSASLTSWANGDAGFTEGTWKSRPIVIKTGDEYGDDELSYNNGIATWYFRVVDGVAEIYRKGNKTAIVSDAPIMNLSLPDTLGGYVVKGIGNCALSDLRGITAISIPNTYEWIGDYAFSNCTSLASASLGKGLERIGHWPFYGTKITTLEISDSISEIDGNPVAGCPLMQSIKVSDSQPLFSVNDDLLYDKRQKTLIACPAKKESITLPESLKTINDDAFYGCNLLKHSSNTAVIDGVTWGFVINDDGSATITSVQDGTGLITIPAELAGYPVSEIADGAFVSCSDVTAFTSESTAFKTRNGVLYSADGTELVCVPNTMKLPYTVTTSNITATVTETSDAGVSGDLPYVNVTIVTNTSTAIVSTQSEVGDITFESLLSGVTHIRGYAFSGVNTFANDYTSVTNGPSSGMAIPGDGTVHSYVTTTSIKMEFITYSTTFPLSSEITMDANAFSGSNITLNSSKTPDISSGGRGDSMMSSSLSNLPPADTQSTYDGYLADDMGNPVGTIQVKVAKAKKDSSKITATIRLAGRRSTMRGTLNTKTGAVSGIDLMLGNRNMFGNLNGYNIIGARNLFVSKRTAEVTKANELIKPWLGTLNVAWSDGILSVSISTKGKVKLSGTASNGVKLSASTQLIIGEDMLYIPVTIEKKSNISFLLHLPNNSGEARIYGLRNAVVGKPGALIANDAVFQIDTDDTARMAAFSAKSPIDAVVVDDIPDSIFLKAGGQTPSKLKIRFTAKTGTFKGSFKVYVVNGRRKTITVNVAGVMIGNAGYGIAYIKKAGQTSIMIR